MLSNSNKSVRRTTSTGWGTQPATPWLTEPCSVTVRYENPTNSNYLYFGVVSEGFTNFRSTLNGNHAWAFKRDGGMYRTGSRCGSGDHRFDGTGTCTMEIVPGSHIAMQGHRIDGVPGRVRVAVCFGGANQQMHLEASDGVTASAAAVEPRPTGPPKANNTAFKWHTAEGWVGRDIVVTERNLQVTRTNSSGWGAQIVNTIMERGVFCLKYVSL